MSVDAANVFMMLDVYYVRHDLVLGTCLRLLRHASETATFESFFRGRTFLNKNVARQLIPDECWIYARKKNFCVCYWRGYFFGGSSHISFPSFIVN